MIEKSFGEKKFSPRGMYIRGTSDIPLKWENMRNIADIQKLCEIGGKGLDMR